MKKMNNMWGGEYVAPALEELNVTVECGFAGSLTEYTDTAGTEGYSVFSNGEDY